MTQDFHSFSGWLLHLAVSACEFSLFLFYKYPFSLTGKQTTTKKPVDIVANIQ